jgi:hypothetical protein
MDGVGSLEIVVDIDGEHTIAVDTPAHRNQVNDQLVDIMRSVSAAAVMRSKWEL